jgi:hypothetical protein
MMNVLIIMESEQEQEMTGLARESVDFAIPPYQLNCMYCSRRIVAAKNGT